MRSFACPHCGQLVFFENSACLRCGSELRFDPALGELVVPGAGDARCANAGVAACNWLAEGPGELCASCLLTRTRPADGDVDGMPAFAEAEAAKRRLLFELHELWLPVESFRDRDGGLAFELLSSAAGSVTTGHADGVITLDLAETDDARREMRREQLGEPYRTVLGHLRHEVAHYYQPILVPPDGPLIGRCRELFGDERADYGAALQTHYENGPPSDWADRHVSAYATMHPWEDWAETFAHYLHIADSMQTAASYGLRTAGADAPVADPRALRARPDRIQGDFRATLDEWVALSYALNAMNRSMGKDDLYPFTLPHPVVEKLSFVDDAVRATVSAAG